MSKMLFSSVLLLRSVIAAAQLSIGPEVSANQCVYILNIGNGAEYHGPASGYGFGVNTDLPLTGRWHMQQGLFYVKTGDSPMPRVGGTNSYKNIRSLQVPVSVIYKFADGKPATPFIGIGPYVGVNTNGNVKVSGSVGIPPRKGTDPYTRTLNIGSSAGDDIRLLDAGIKIVGGFEMATGMHAMLSFQRGLVNEMPSARDTRSLRNACVNISVGYFIRTHKHRQAEVTETK